MSEPQRLQRDIHDLQQQEQRLSALLAALQQEHIGETRIEERLRLQRLIDQRQAERDAIETQLRRLEAALYKAERISEARRLERNQAYAEAARIWAEVVALDPNDSYSAQELQRLQERQQRAGRLQDYLRRLSQRIAEIKTIFVPLTRQVKQMLEGGEEDATLLGLIENFLDRTLTAEDLISMVRDLEGPRAPAAAPSMNFQALAARMQRGEIVCCLGSDIPALFDANAPDTSAMVAKLAAQVNYAAAQGALSMVAEYYHMKPEYGRSSLVHHLRQILPDAPLQVPLYDLLASIEPPLILISAAYDTLLEQALQRAGKRYVLMTSLLGLDAEADVGKVVLHYSDRATPEAPCLEQTLSDRDVLGQGYSVLYKIRGALGAPTLDNLPQQHALTLSEENYFTLARHMDKVIPNYLVRQFTGRGLWFLGYTPRYWEDRLLTNALLARRQQHGEPANVVRQDPDDFEEMYWHHRGVRRHAWDLQEFVRRLKEHCA